MCYTDSPDTDKQREEMNTWEIKGEQLEFIEDGHIYLYGGIILPSITTILKAKFGGKYTNVSRDVLQRASELGTQVHEAIEDYEKRGYEMRIIIHLWQHEYSSLSYSLTIHAVPS